MVGKTVSHYRIIEKLGEGGMGVVYKAEDTKLDRPVALKFLAAHALGDEDEKARFVREAKAAAALSHPGIATVFALEEFDDRLYIVYEYVEGKTLREEIEDRAVGEVVERRLDQRDELPVLSPRKLRHKGAKSDRIGSLRRASKLPA